MMNERIRELLLQIRSIEDEIEDVLLSQQEHILYQLKDGKIKFKQGIREAHKDFKESIIPWLLDSNFKNLLSAPFIYCMIIPMVIFDFSLWLYQYVCFPLYGIKRVKRNNYITIDRLHLEYLNSIEKLNCAYCGYANGLLSYAREITALTELYWCPIKHANKIIDKHTYYHKFSDYGDAENYRKILNESNQH